jgi:hypothetical protein
MQIYLSPQVSEERIEYEFAGEVITATLNGVTDTFDFTGLTDGFVERADVETDLGVNPIIEAHRENGVLYITLLNYIGFDASEDERFPQWVEV